MRSSAARVLLVYGAIASVAVMNACAAGSNNDGYTPPVSTTRQPPADVDATTSSGDDGGGITTPGDDGTVAQGEGGDDGGADGATDDGDDGGGEAGPAPCAAGQTCVDLAPAGWTGYVQLRLAAVDAGTGACSAPYAAVQQAGVADPSGAPAKCAACTCGAPTTPVGCVSGVSGGNLLCIATDTPNPLSPGMCTSTFNPFNILNGGTAAPTVSTAASCPGQGGQVVGGLDASPPIPAVVCALGSGDGGAGGAVDAAATDAAPRDAGASPTPPTCDPSSQACASPISSQAGPSGVCIFQSGLVTCPTGTGFTEQHVVGNSVADTRGCACACGAASCPTDGYIEGFTNTGCTGTPAATFDAGAACGSSLHGATAFKYIQSRSSSTGTCAVVDAGPTGGVSVDSTTALTLCCIP